MKLKPYILLFLAAFALFVVLKAPYISLADHVLRSQKLPFTYSRMSGTLSSFTLHNVALKKAPDIQLSQLQITPKWHKLFMLKGAALVNADVLGGNISLEASKNIFSEQHYADIQLKNINIAQMHLPENFVLNRYAQDLTGYISGDIHVDGVKFPPEHIKADLRISSFSAVYKEMEMLLKTAPVRVKLTVDQERMYSLTATAAEQPGHIGIKININGELNPEAIGLSTASGSVDVGLMPGASVKVPVGGQLSKIKIGSN